VFILFLVSSAATAQPVILTVDPSFSSLTAEVCVQGTCDSDVSTVSGFADVTADDYGAISELTLNDFEFVLDDQIDINIDLGILGGVVATGNGISTSYSIPGIPFGPSPVAADQFMFADVPALADGVVDYEASGFACLLVKGAGLACDDTIDLGTLGELLADEIGGSITLEGKFLVMAAGVSVTVPLDPETPELGTLSIFGTVVGVGLVPALGMPGDFDDDGDVDLTDFGAFQLCFTGSDGGPVGPECEPGDFDGDGDVDLTDFGSYQLAFTGSI
jgi:hypothetical protein